MFRSYHEFLKNRYDPISNPTISYQHDPRLGLILSFLRQSDTPTKLLDIGCYDGYIGSLLKKKLGTLCEIYGIDVAKNSVKLARKRGIHAKVCNVTGRIEFKSNTFDYIFAGEIIEHLQDTDFFMREVKRVLKPDGTLILTTPNFLSLGRRIHYLFGKGIYMEASFHLPKNAAGHIRYFTFETLRELISYHSFDPIVDFSDIVTFTSSGFGSMLLAKIFPTLGRSIILFARNKK